MIVMSMLHVPVSTYREVALHDTLRFITACIFIIIYHCRVSLIEKMLLLFVIVPAQFLSIL